MAFPDEPRDLKVGFAFGHSVAEDPTGLSFEQIAPGAGDDPGPVLGSVTITRGRVGDASTTDPTTIETSLRDTDGDFSPRNVEGEHYGELLMDTPVQVAVDIGAGDVVLGTAFVPDWNPTWDGPDVNDRVAINAEGILGHLNRNLVEGSALRRAHTKGALADGLIAYYPLDNATSGDVSITAPALDLVAGYVAAPFQPLFFHFVLGGVEWTSDGPVGAAGSVRLSSAALIARPHITIGAEAFPTVAGEPMRVGMAFKFVDQIPDSPLTGGEYEATIIRIFRYVGLSGTNESWAVRLITSGAGTLFNINTFHVNSGGSVDVTNTTAVPLTTNRWYYLTLSFESASGGASTTYRTMIDDALVHTGTAAIAYASTNSVRSLNIASDVPGIGNVSALSLWSGSSIPAEGAGYEAFTAHLAESAADRIQRLCTEEGVAVDLTAGDTSAMGPQKPGTLLQLLRECEAADHGVLLERRNGLLGYDPLTSRYNLPVALTLTYGSETDPDADVSNLRQFDDKRDLYNLITVTGRDGSEATAERVGGPVGTDAIGPRPKPVTLNLATVDQLAQHAGWLLHAGTIDKPRYVITLNPFSNENIRSDILPCGQGSRIAVTGAPAKHAGPDDLDLIVEGEVIEVGADVWTVMWWCEPYAVLAVRTLASDSNAGRLDTQGCVTAEALDSTETGVDVTNDDGGWSTTAVPYDIVIGGEQMTVTAASTPGTSQTLTVTRSVNGVVKSHDAGAVVQLVHPLRLTP